MGGGMEGLARNCMIFPTDYFWEVPVPIVAQPGAIIRERYVCIYLYCRQNKKHEDVEAKLSVPSGFDNLQAPLLR